MSTAQILTIVGYGIGSITPIGPQLGAFLGGAVGTVLAPSENAELVACEPQLIESPSAAGGKRETSEAFA
jgi:hypothetical protein